MTVVLIFGAVAGIILELGRFKILALLPVIVIVAAGAIVNGLATGLEPRIIAFGVLVAVASPQIGYLVSLAPTSPNICGYERLAGCPVSLHAIQTEIEQPLRTKLELPRQLLREMVALRAQSGKARGAMTNRAAPTTSNR